MISRIPTFSQFLRESENISNQFDKLSQMMQQADSGKRLVHSSDDPVLASQINSKQDFINTLTGYFDNGDIAQGRSSIVGAASQGAVNVINQISTLLKQAQTGTKTDAERASIASQLKGYLSNLVNISNTVDANGQYVFSGSNPTSPAYALVNGSYQYQGADQSVIDIAPGVSTVYGESGANAFGNIYTGNGTFTVTAPSTNTGTAFTTPGNVTTGYVADNYTITFGKTAGGTLVYEVVGANSGQVIPPLPSTFPAQAPAYQSGSDINFNGVSVNITGQPNVGDTFQVKPSAQQNMFNTVQSAVDLLNTPVTNTGQFNQAINQAAASVAQVLQHVTGYVSDVGSRAGVISTQVTMNKTTLTQQTSTLSDLENADLPTLYSALSQQSLALQVTQASYQKIQDAFMRLLQLSM